MGFGRRVESSPRVAVLVPTEQNLNSWLCGSSPLFTHLQPSASGSAVYGMRRSRTPGFKVNERLDEATHT